MRHILGLVVVPEADTAAAHGEDDFQSGCWVVRYCRKVHQTSLCIGQVGGLWEEGRIVGIVGEDVLIRSLVGAGFHRRVVVDCRHMEAAAGLKEVVRMVVVGLRVVVRMVVDSKSYHMEVVDGWGTGHMSALEFHMIAMEGCFGWHKGVVEVELEGYRRCGLSHWVGRT